MTCNGTIDFPCIVQDINYNSLQVDNWRDTLMLVKAYSKHNGDVDGLANLWMSGSAQPSEAAWKTIQHLIELITQNKVKKIVDIDLRQESHGYVNGIPITLVAGRDIENLHKTHDEVLKTEQAWLSDLAHHTIIKNVLTSTQYHHKNFKAGKTIFVHSIKSEEETVKKLNIDYQRLTVTDRMAPNQREVDRFITIIKNLPNNSWVHFHCRGGIGRTTTFMAMYDMLRNANKVSLYTILKREASVAPFYDLSYANRELIQQERLKFLHKFYQFSKVYQKNNNLTWTGWLASQ